MARKKRNPSDPDARLARAEPPREAAVTEQDTPAAIPPVVVRFLLDLRGENLSVRPPVTYLPGDLPEHPRVTDATLPLLRLLDMHTPPRAAQIFCDYDPDPRERLYYLAIQYPPKGDFSQSKLDYALKCLFNVVGAYWKAKAFGVPLPSPDPTFTHDGLTLRLMKARLAEIASQEWLLVKPADGEGVRAFTLHNAPDLAGEWRPPHGPPAAENVYNLS